MGTKMVRVSGWADMRWSAILAEATRTKRSIRLSLQAKSVIDPSSSASNAHWFVICACISAVQHPQQNSRVRPHTYHACGALREPAKRA